MFTAKTLDFLFENKLNDSRDWFEAHKEDYRKLVQEPVQELAAQLAPGMLKIDGNIVPDARRAVSRIRRDTRFSHDKSLYRENMWIVFQRSKGENTELPGFYFDISGNGFSYGCGYYSASTSYMTRLRELALAGDKSFLKAKKAFEKQKVFGLEGDLYKRSRFPDQPEDMRSWLDRRGISFNAHSKDFPLLFSAKLGEKLNADFQLLAPMYDFMLEVAHRNISAVQQAETV